MEGEAIGNGCGDASSKIEATVTGAESSFTTIEHACDMPSEMFPGSDTQLPRPRIQYSTDLRKELSLDVLASLGDTSADEAKPLEDSILDLASLRADMDFISELSSLGLPSEHVDATVPMTFVPSSATRPVDPNPGLDTPGAALPPSSTTFLSSFPSIPLTVSPFPISAPPYTDSSTIASLPLAVDSLPSVPPDSSSVALLPLTFDSVSSAAVDTSEPDSVEVPLASPSAPISDAVPAIEDSLISSSDQVTSAPATIMLSPHVPSVESSDASSAEIPSPHPREEVSTGDLADPLDLEAAQSSLEPSSKGSLYPEQLRSAVARVLSSGRHASSPPCSFLPSAALDVPMVSTPPVSPTYTPDVVNPPVSDAAPASFVPSLDLPKVLPGDLLFSPHTARFWDVSTSSGPSLSPGLSLGAYFDGSRSPFRGRKSARRKKASESDVNGKGLNESEKMEDVAELESMLEAQKKMVQWQINEIHRISAVQCQLTGTSPLSEEMVLEVIGVKTGKKSGDILSPAVLNCLQEVFAMKDTITKKEARDISVTSGASLMQVREFFAAQRSLVRKLVQQAHDEAGRLGVKNASEQSQQIPVLNTVTEAERDIEFDRLTGAESMEKFLELMRLEKSFAGQAQLLQIILRTDSTALILRRFLEKGGLKTLGVWLGETVEEEQTSVICYILKVLNHLPISHVVPSQMPPLVQNVNKLRFYNASDIAEQARSLLTKWSKLFLSKAEVVKIPGSPGVKPTAESEASPPIPMPIPSSGSKRNRDLSAAQRAPPLRKKKVRAEEAVHHDIKASPDPVPSSPNLNVNGLVQGSSEHPSSTQPVSVPVPAPVLVPPSKQRWSDTLQPSESAVAAVSVSRKRLASKSLGDQSRDRRKVLLVEDHHGKSGSAGGSKQSTILKNSRPLSTDDIYKAKKLQRLMQEPVKPKRTAVAQEHPEAHDRVASHLKRSTSASEQADPMKKVSAVTPKSDQTRASQGISVSSSQGESQTLKGTPTSMTLEQLHSTRTITPILSHVPSRATMRPTSSQEVSLQGAEGDKSADGSYFGDQAAIVEVDTGAPLSFSPLKELKARNCLGEILPTPAETPEGISQTSGDVTSVVGELTIADCVESEVSGGTHAPQEQKSVAVLGMKDLGHVESWSVSCANTKPTRQDGSSILSASKEPSKAGLEDILRLSTLQAEQNFVEKCEVHVSGCKAASTKEQDLETANDPYSMPGDTTLVDFYAALRASMIRWRVPPEYQPDSRWNVAAGEDSKEKEVQSGRVKREEEVYYAEASAIPDDPKDPWEEEPSYDDSLTLEIFVDNGHRKGLSGVNQTDICDVMPSDMNPSAGLEVPSLSKPNPAHKQASDTLGRGPSRNRLDQVLQQVSGGGGGATHDPDLLALLLRNPELVSQLTSAQTFTSSGLATSPGVFMQPMDPLRQGTSIGNNGIGLSAAVGDLGQDRLTTSNNSKALRTSQQSGRSVSSVDQTPSESMRVQDSITMIPPNGMGQQQTLGFAQVGLDSRFLTPQMPSVPVRNIQDSSGWEQARVPPPPPPLPPVMQTVPNQLLQPPLPSQPNKMQNWPDSQNWASSVRPPMNSPQHHVAQEQLHGRPQPIMAHNAGLANYGGMVGIPQGEGPSITSVVPQQETGPNQRSWSNGTQLVAPVHENSMLQTNQESGIGRNNRWPRPPGRPPDQHTRASAPDPHAKLPLDQYVRASLAPAPDPHMRSGAPEQYVRTGVNPDQHLRSAHTPDQHVRSAHPSDQHVRSAHPSDQHVRSAHPPDQHVRSGGPPDQHMRSGVPDQQTRPGVSDQHMRPGVSDQHMRPGVSDQHMRPLVPDQHMRSGIPDQNMRSGIPDQNMRSGVSDQHLRSGVSDQHLRSGVPLDQHLRSGSGLHHQHLRPGGRDFTDFTDFNSRQANVVDNRPIWAPNDRTRPGLSPFQGGFGLPPPPLYLGSQWQGQEALNIRSVQGVSAPFLHGRDLRPPQQQLWQSNLGPPRQVWRGP